MDHKASTSVNNPANVIAKVRDRVSAEFGQGERRGLLRKANEDEPSKWSYEGTSGWQSFRQRCYNIPIASRGRRRS